MVMRHHEELRQKEERAKREEHAKLRRIAASIAKEVRAFWSSVEKVTCWIIVLNFQVQKLDKSFALVNELLNN